MQGKQERLLRFGFQMFGRGLSYGVVICSLLLMMAQHAFASGVLTYSGTNITARWQNDGGFNPLQSTITITLGSGQVNNFTPSISNLDYVSLGWVTPTNLPSGLTAVVKYKTTNTVTVGLNGFHTPNNISQNISNLFLTFSDNAFSNNSPGAASSIAGYNGTNQISICFLLSQSNWYVNVNSGLESNNGTNSTTPFKSITNAIAHAQTTANDVINIAAGTYPVTQITVNKILTFAGTNAALTIIDGGAANGLFNYTVNGYSTQFQNLTLQNGRNAGAGGAISMNGSDYADLIVTNCCFFNNSATTNYGGAIYHGQNGGANYLTLVGCVFSNNVATNAPNETAGAVYCFSDIVTMSNCVFVGNSASTNGAAFYDQGGASLVNCVFINNTLLNPNGQGGAIFQSTTGKGSYLYGCTIANNSAPGGGGGIYTVGSVIATNATFYGNVSSNGSGGAIGGGSASYPIDLYNCTLCGNSALTGGAVRALATVQAYSSIIASNTATTGVAPDIYQSTGNLIATNSLIGNTNGIGSASTMVGASATATNGAGNYGGSTATPANPGIQPLANNGGVVPTCALLPTSLAIHHGYNPMGLLYDARGPGYFRVSGMGCDMGAYEMQPPTGELFTFR